MEYNVNLNPCEEVISIEKACKFQENGMIDYLGLISFLINKNNLSDSGEIDFLLSEFKKKRKGLQQFFGIKFYKVGDFYDKFTRKMKPKINKKNSRLIINEGIKIATLIELIKNDKYTKSDFIKVNSLFLKNNFLKNFKNSKSDKLLEQSILFEKGYHEGKNIISKENDKLKIKANKKISKYIERYEKENINKSEIEKIDMTSLFFDFFSKNSSKDGTFISSVEEEDFIFKNIEEKWKGDVFRTNKILFFSYGEKQEDQDLKYDMDNLKKIGSLITIKEKNKKGQLSNVELKELKHLEDYFKNIKEDYDVLFENEKERIAEKIKERYGITAFATNQFSVRIDLLEKLMLYLDAYREKGVLFQSKGIYSEYRFIEQEKKDYNIIEGEAYYFCNPDNDENDKVFFVITYEFPVVLNDEGEVMIKAKTASSKMKMAMKPNEN